MKPPPHSHTHEWGLKRVPTHAPCPSASPTSQSTAPPHLRALTKERQALFSHALANLVHRSRGGKITFREFSGWWRELNDRLEAHSASNGSSYGRSY